MTRRKRVKMIPCPACNNPFPDALVGHGIALSRYVNINICSICGVKEAIDSFFWEKKMSK